MIGWLRALERVTRPPRMGHDVDSPLAAEEAERDVWEPGELLAPSVMTLDDVVAQLAQLSYYAEDIRNILNSSPPAGLTTNAGDAPAGVDADPPTRPPAGPDLATWLEPAVCEVLAEHVPSPDRGNDPAVICHDSRSHRRYLDDWQAWREHVAPLISAHIVKALAAQPK